MKNCKQNEEWCSTTAEYRGQWGHCKPRGDPCTIISPVMKSTAVSVKDTDASPQSQMASRQWAELGQALVKLEELGTFDANGRFSLPIQVLKERLKDMPELSPEEENVVAMVIDSHRPDGVVDLVEMLEAWDQGILPRFDGTPRSLGMIQDLLKFSEDLRKHLKLQDTQDHTQ